MVRAGTLSGPEESVALYDGRVFVVTDEHGGRKLHDATAGDQILVPEGGEWISRLQVTDVLTAWDASPISAPESARSFDGQRWHAGSVHAQPPVSTYRRPRAPLSFQARRISPGISSCRVVDNVAGEVLARWTAPLMGTGAWYGDRLWLLYEAWPKQYLVGLDTDTFETTEKHALPIGRLSSLVLTPSLSAAAWSDPSTPASLVTAPTLVELLGHVWAHADTRASVRPRWQHRTAVCRVADVPSIVNTPMVSPRGTLLMLHGGPHAITWPTFSPLTAYLCRLGWRVVAPNVCSSAMAAPRANGSCRLGVDDALDVVRLAATYRGGGPVVVCGWSYGAYVAARAAALGMDCDGLVSLSGFLSPETIGVGHAAVAAFRQGHPLPATDRADLGDLPVLAIHGRHDDRVPLEGHRAYIEALPNGSFVELPEDGHGIITDGGAALAYPALASWLGSL